MADMVDFSDLGERELLALDMYKAKFGAQLSRDLVEGFKHHDLPRAVRKQLGIIRRRRRLGRCRQDFGRIDEYSL
jgi:hypothetical protein